MRVLRGRGRETAVRSPVQTQSGDTTVFCSSDWDEEFKLVLTGVDFRPFIFIKYLFILGESDSLVYPIPVIFETWFYLSCLQLIPFPFLLLILWWDVLFVDGLPPAVWLKKYLVFGVLFSLVYIRDYKLLAWRMPGVIWLKQVFVTELDVTILKQDFFFKPKKPRDSGKLDRPHKLL